MLQLKSSIALITSVLLILILFLPTVAASEDGTYVFIDEITVTFQDGNASIDMRYHMDIFTRFYYLLMGGRYVESGISDLFLDFENLTLTHVNETHASMEVKDISQPEDGHYWSKPSWLSQQIPKTVFNFPDGSSQMFIGLDILPRLQY